MTKKKVLKYFKRSIFCYRSTEKSLKLGNNDIDFIRDHPRCYKTQTIPALLYWHVKNYTILELAHVFAQKLLALTAHRS